MESRGLSMVAQFDDLCRSQLPLFIYHEAEWLRFLQEEEKLRGELRENSSAVDNLKHELQLSRKEKQKLEITLEHVRKELEQEMGLRKSVQMEAEKLARQMELIKELVNTKNHQSFNLLSEEDKQKLAFLNNSRSYNTGSPSMMDGCDTEDSVSLLSDSAYDKTGDDLCTPHRHRSKRKSHQRQPSGPHVLSDDIVASYPKQPTAPPESEERTPPKRVKRSDTDSRPVPQTEMKPRRSNRNVMRRSLSVGNPVDADDTDSLCDLETGRLAAITSSIPARGILKKGRIQDMPSTPPESPTIKRWASASKLNRAHNLFEKNVLKPETCTPCGKKIKFGRTAHKCKDCRVVCHPECKEALPQLCIPTATTPTKGTQGTMISDFAPADPPFVPAILLQCVNEVESRGFSEEGIYRKPGSDREVRELKERFMRGKDPHLELVSDIHVVCSCLKDFLRNLKEPLIPTSMWSSFVNAANLQNEAQRQESIRNIVKELPSVNRDCIAFLVIHLQRVTEKPGCRMGVDNLAKVFGPTVVGYSTATPQPMQMISETRPQQAVMEALMTLSADYWTNMLSCSSENGSECCERAIDVPTALGQGMISDMRSTMKVKQFFGESPRYNVQKNKSFFPSPMLK